MEERRGERHREIERENWESRERRGERKKGREREGEEMSG